MNLTVSSAKKAIITFLHRFHVLIFVFIVANGSIAVVLLLNGNIITSGEAPTNYTSTSSQAAFDEATIKRIKELKTRDQSSTEIDLSQGRTNPFVE